MGAQVSKVNLSNDYYTELISQSLISIAHRCAVNSTQTQSIDLKNEGKVVISDVSFAQDSTISLSCIQNLENDLANQVNAIDDITEKIITKISGQTIGAQVDLTDQVTKAVTKVVNNLNYESITECLGSLAQEQEIKFENAASGDIYIAGVDMSQTADLVQRCIQNDSTTISNISELKKTVKKTLEKEAEGFLTFRTTIVIAVIFLIILIAIGLIVWLIKYLKGGEATTDAAVTTALQNLNTNVDSGSGSGNFGKLLQQAVDFGVKRGQQFLNK